ncbi:TPR-domain containing protein [Lunatimonas lonarensis]|uniref:TPR-domain containing protein n=2 Tax=Lunatimonas lonarensis TaxID=1232681 RepID=R7ZR66_9BACT|nr:TPR-domain containing protein [Lunatimonas lonarensis]
MFRYFLLSVTIGVVSQAVFGQQATVSESKRTFTTYPFGDPTPIAAFAYKPDIYPYFRFEGYSVQPVDQEWKEVRLENDYLSVSILPEIGGRVWGAREKSTGYDFIYENGVVKFRNIAMRGPWASGGIEFNFGIIGHAPSTASPVDYVYFENPDGSVTCVVGTMDLPSRTQWRVKINLPKDKAYFETEGLWYNPEPLRQPYYNWMTAAAHVGDDQEFFYPGHIALQHSGSLIDWPIQDGRNVAMYRENNFGSSKSHHMAGSFQNHFGGYFHDKGVGFGHFSNYEEMPGKKLWLWALSRSGGIWEDLLTDNDGQYMEFQAGRMLNQFSPTRQVPTPLTKAGFTPYTLDKWTDYWFPVKQTGGISEVSTDGVFFVENKNGQVGIRFNPFRTITGELEFWIDGQKRGSLPLNAKPMDVINHTLAVREGMKHLEIKLKNKTLYAWQEKDPNRLSRPFDAEPAPKLSEADDFYYQARQEYNSRNYNGAKKLYENCLEIDPGHQRARIDLSELAFRFADYDVALAHIVKALSTDFYDPQANFVAASIYREKDQPTDALEAYGWAARSMEFRSGAYTAMSEIYLHQDDLAKAETYARKALDYNRYQVMAYQVLAVAARLTDRAEHASNWLNQLLEIDPLSHFARFEQYLLKLPGTSLSAFDDGIKNEFPFQTYLEIASIYLKYGRNEDAIAALKSSPTHALVHLWHSYLEGESGGSQLDAFLAKPIDWVFPFRKETFRMLEWAVKEKPHWKSSYYLALNGMNLGRESKSKQLLVELGNAPDEYSFYLNRAALLKDYANYSPLDDLQKALEMDPGQWRNHHRLAQTYEHMGDHGKQQEILEAAVAKFPGNYMLELDLIRSWAALGAYEKAMKGLSTIHVLPYEGAGEGRNVFEQVYLNAALEDLREKRFREANAKVTKSLEWPENLGVGKPFETDETIQNYLFALIAKAAGRQKAYRNRLEMVVGQPESQSRRLLRPQSALVIRALEDLNRKDEADKLWNNIQQGTNRQAVINLGVLTGRITDQEVTENREYQLMKKILDAAGRN